MNKGKRFWQELWESGNLPFHREVVNDDLIQFGPLLPVAEKTSILVPLCGKSLDLLWLVEQGFDVIGIELSELAVQQLAAENHIPLQKQGKGPPFAYKAPSLTIWTDDIFTLPTNLIEPVDGLYDRAALIALPASLRPDYAHRCLGWLKPKGRILLKTLAYEQGQMAGPPYRVAADELTILYPGCQLQLLKERQRDVDQSDSLFVRGLSKVIDSVWLIERN